MNYEEIISKYNLTKEQELILKTFPIGNIGRAIDLTGQTFNHFTVLFRDGSPHPRPYWVCLCSCGKILSVQGAHLGITISCGHTTSERKKQLNLKKMQSYDFGFLEVYDLDEEKNRNKKGTNFYYLCKCKNCGNPKFSIRGDSLMSGTVISCGCYKQSIGEAKIQRILQKNNINFKKEYYFNDLKNPKTKQLLRFDFAIFNKEDKLEYLIEFDGKQHFKENPFLNDTLEETQYRDTLKNQYCKNHNIKLKRIPYYDIDKITLKTLQDDTFTI